MKKLDIEQQISQMLDEVRVVLPGTQTLLGFQLASIFAEGFSKLSSQLKLVHLGSLCFITLAIIFLMAVPAYDRIVHNDTASKNFVKFSSRMILVALVFLALGLSTDIFVVIMKVIGNMIVALLSGVFIFLLSTFLWFGYSYVTRKQDQ